MNYIIAPLNKILLMVGIVLIAATFSFFAYVPVAQADSSLTEAQIHAILNLLESFGASDDVIQGVSVALGYENSSSADITIVPVQNSVINNPRVIRIDNNSFTRNVEVLEFNIRSDVSVVLDSLPVTFRSENVSLSTILDNIILEIDDDPVAYVGSFSSGDNMDVIFEDIDYDLEPGETYTVKVVADINHANSWNSANLTAQASNVIGGPHELRLVGGYLSNIQTSAEKITKAEGDTGVYEISFDLTAFGGSIYIPSNFTANGYNRGIVTKVSPATSYEGQVASNISAYANTISDHWYIQEGSTERFTSSVTLNNMGSGVTGTYRVFIDSILISTNYQGQGTDYENIATRELRTGYLTLYGGRPTSPEISNVVSDADDTVVQGTNVRNVKWDSQSVDRVDILVCYKSANDQCFYAQRNISNEGNWPQVRVGTNIPVGSEAYIKVRKAGDNSVSARTETFNVVEGGADELVIGANIELYGLTNNEWELGTAHNLTWNKDAFATDKVDLLLCNKNHEISKCHTLRNNVANDGRGRVTVPNTKPYGQYFISVQEYNGRKDLPSRKTSLFDVVPTTQSSRAYFMASVGSTVDSVMVSVREFLTSLGF